MLKGIDSLLPLGVFAKQTTFDLSIHFIVRLPPLALQIYNLIQYKVQKNKKKIKKKIFVKIFV